MSERERQSDSKWSEDGTDCRRDGGRKRERAGSAGSGKARTQRAKTKCFLF